MRSCARRASALFLAALLAALPVFANSTAHPLGTSNLSQDWSNNALITANDNWSGVPSIQGFLGQDLTTTTGTDPQTILTGASAVAGDLSVLANLTTSASTAGDVGEFHTTSQAAPANANSTIGLQGSGTADAPHIILYLNTTGRQNVNVAYTLRDIDCSTDNAVQAVALQYRVGSSGNFTNIASGYVADATTGPSICTATTAVSAVLPAAANNQSEVQVRIITTNAAGNDEWVGVDDIVVSSSVAATSITIDDISLSEGNAGTTAYNFTVSLSAPAGPGGVTFDIATADNTATTADSDYVSRSLTGQTIPSGSSTYSFSVDVTGDTAIESDETFFVNITSVTGAVAGDAQGQGTIVNDDSPPTLSIGDVPVAEGNSGTSTATFTVQLSAPAQAGGVTFDITTAAGTATAGTDYVEQTLTGQTIAAGATSATFVVTINGDTTFEPTETYTVTVSNVTGATISDATATGTITNDDAAPSFSVGDLAITEGDAGTQVMTFTVTLSAAAASTMTVDYATADSSATTADADYVGTSGTLTFNAGTTTQTIEVTVNGDTASEGNEQYFVNLTNATGGATISDAQALGVIRTDDAFSIAAVDTIYSENFNSLATTTAATTPASWTYAETGAQANATYRADTGSSTTGDVYSYGAAAATDRAFGTLQSGNLIPTIGAFYVNDTGVPITTLSIAYTGEQWRLGAASRTDRLDFQYSIDATSVSDSAGTWVSVDSLDFTAPVTAGTGSKDGNVAPNRAAVAYTITGLSIAPGDSFWIRWTDFNASGADDGLAIDDFSIVANIAGGVLTINDVTQLEGDAGTTTMTFTVTLSEPARAGGVTFDIATADNTATVADGDYVANSATAVTIPQGSTTYTFDVTVNGDLTEEPSQSFFVNVTNVVGALASDAQGVGTIAGDDFTFTAIHDVQGNGLTSPLNGSTVTVNGIVTGIKTGSSGGFFVQAADDEIDADPNTSEGIFVFTGGTVPSGAVIGNRVAVTGTVSEFPSASTPNTVTELTGTIDVSVLSTGETLPAAVTITAADGAPSSNINQYERFEGMRVAATLTVVAPTDGSINEPNATASSNGVFYAVIAGVERPFREEGIPVTDTIPAEASCPACIPRFDNNPEKLRVDSDNQPGATQLNVVAGQTISNVVGVLDFGFLEYTILPEAATVPVVTGPSTYTAVPTPLASELTVGALNLFHFYDTIDDGPTSDVVLTPAAYNERLQKASLAIRTVLKSPDVLGVIEVENINALSDLAARINADSVAATGTNPNYQAYLQEGHDIGGIDVGFLVKSSRVVVDVASVAQIGRDATYTNPDTNLQERLNDRPSLVLEASIVRPDGSAYPFVAIVNHTRSLIGAGTDDAAGRRVRAKRAAQAEYLANYVQSRQVANPTERIILVGDFNAFTFNDGLVDVIGTITGDPAPANEVVRPTSDLVDPNLTNLVDLLPEEQRYSYTFDGNAQTLDHALVNDDLLLDYTRVAFARFDGDFPIIFYPDETRPERLSDHDGIVAFFDLNTYPGALAFSSSTYSTSESTTTFDVTVTRSGGTEGAVAATYTISAGTADSADFTAATGTVSFNDGETSKTFSVTIANDALDEADETIALALSSPTGGATLGTQTTATLTITDNDATPSISIDDVSVSEADGTATLTVSLTNGSASTVTVNFATANGTATAGSDYTANSGTVTFVPGDISESIVVSLTNDTTFEPSETVLVNLTTPSGATIADAQGVITITNDDGAPTLAINDISFAEGNAGTTVATLTVALTGTTSQTVTVDYATANGTATAGSDYTATSGTLTFTPGTATQSINVTVTGDVVHEPAETILVNLTNPATATVADAQGVITVTNEDAVPTLAINDISFAEGNGGTTVATLTVTLTGTTSQTVTVDYATANGTATAGSDYTATSGTLTFTPGTATQSVNVTVTGDVVNEPAETILVNLTNPANATVADAQGVITVTNDDAVPTLAINDISFAEGNGGTTIATLTVTLTGTASQTVTVNYGTANGTASSGSDYTATSGTLTFLSGTATQSINVTITGDVVNEPAETILVNLHNPANATVSDSEGVITLTNDDTAPVITINDINFTEGNDGTTTARLTLTMTGSSSELVTVDYATANGTATAGSDYTATSGTIAFMPNVTQMIEVTVTGDMVNEPDETILVNLSNPTNGTIGDAQGVITLINDDGAPVLVIDDVTVNESAATATLTVTLIGTTAQTVTVDYATANGTATAGSDYTATNGTLTFVAGVLTQTIEVALTADAANEPDETILVNLTNATNATVSDAQGVITITNDDATPGLAIGDLSVNENAGTATLTVTLTGTTTQVVTVDFATANGTATAGSDYTATSGTLTFNVGVTTQTLEITINPDALNETDETVLVNLSNATNASISDAQGVLTILNDDALPALAINDISVNETAGTATLTVTLTGATAQTVTVDYATANGTAAAGSDYTATNGTLTFVAGVLTQTIEVPIANDATHELDETLFVNLSNATNATISDNQGLVTITSEDAVPVLAISDVSVSENGGTATVTVTLTGATSQSVTVDYATVNGTAASGSDYTAANGTLTFNAGVLTQTIDVAITDDATHEPDEVLFVDLSNATNATISDNQGLITITNDDAAPVLTISDFSVNENAGTATLTVTLTGATSQTVTVDYATANGTATGSDYTATNGTLTFTAGVTTRTIEVAILNDAINEPLESFDVVLSNATNATISDATGVVTINDDDGAPTLSINDVTVNEGDGTATFTVTLSGSASGDVTVAYATSNGTANAGSDYTTTTGTLTYSGGVAGTQTVNVPILDDGALESDETFVVTLSSATVATISDATGTGTIIDDDAAAVADLTVNVTSSPASPAAGGLLTFTIAIANNGPGDATGVTLVDQLPAGTTFVSATPAQGTCSGTSTVTCNLGNILNGASTTVTITVQLPESGGSFMNSVAVDSVETDPSGATASTTIVVAASHHAEIPTLSEWGLFALLSALAAFAALRLRA